MGVPVARTIWTVSIIEERPPSADVLWPLILAITDGLIHERVTEAEYHSQIAALAGPAVAVVQAPVRDATGELAPQAVPVGALSSADEIVFPLLHHWTLYDALANTKRVATHLRTWTDNGIGDMRAVRHCSLTKNKYLHRCICFVIHVSRIYLPYCLALLTAVHL